LNREYVYIVGLEPIILVVNTIIVDSGHYNAVRFFDAFYPITLFIES